MEPLIKAVPSLSLIHIWAFFEATADENARISYIKRIFNNDYTEVILRDGRRVGYKTYQNVLQLSLIHI